MYSSLSGAGNPDVQLQLGDSGGLETTGYSATAVFLSSNSGDASPGGAGLRQDDRICYWLSTRWHSSTLHHQ
jgi:hypothetical protein